MTGMSTAKQTTNNVKHGVRGVEIKGKTSKDQKQEDARNNVDAGILFRQQ